MNPPGSLFLLYDERTVLTILPKSFEKLSRMTRNIFCITYDNALRFETGDLHIPSTEIHPSAWNAVAPKISLLKVKLDRQASSRVRPHPPPVDGQTSIAFACANTASTTISPRAHDQDTDADLSSFQTDDKPLNLRTVECPSIGECHILITYAPREEKCKFTAKETDSVGKVIEEFCFSMGINGKRASLKQLIQGSRSPKLLPCANYIMIGRLVPEGREFLLTVEGPQDVGGEPPCA